MFDWNREFLTRGVFVELIAILKFNLFMLLAVTSFLFVVQRGGDFSRLVMGYFLIFDMIIVWLVRLVMKKVLRMYFTSQSNIVKIMVIAKDAVRNVYSAADVQ